jgi:hypothetical protein
MNLPRYFVFTIALINAPTLFADRWQAIDLSQCETEGNWQPQADGSLHLQPREGETGWKRYSSYLWLPGEYTDFVCEFEYKHEADGNSGFYFRVPDTDAPTTVGVEIQLLDCYGKEELGFHDLGGIIAFVDRARGAPLVNASKPVGEWNSIRVKVEENILTVVINGKTVQDEVDLTEYPIKGDLAATGRLGIQDHGLPFWVRNIRVQRLDR